MFYLLLLLLSSSLFAQSLSDVFSSCDPLQREALKEASLALDLSETTEFSLLTGGLTRAKPYLFTHNGTPYVLRFCDLAVSHSTEIRQNETKALKVGASLKLAPPCLFTDQESVLFITPFLDGKALHNPTEEEVTTLAGLIRTLHTTDQSYPEGRTLEERIERHYEKGRMANIAYPTNFKEQMGNVFSSQGSVPCHGDLNPSNILIGSSIQLIDWTLACIDDPFTDLGYFCLLANLDPSQESLFLTAYLERAPTTSDLKELQKQKARTALLISTVWFRFSETIEEKKLPLPLRVAALDAELHSPSLKSASEYLQKWAIVDFNKASKAEVRSYALSFYKAYLEISERHFITQVPSRRS